MPNCFTLLDKETNKQVSFQEVDDRICEWFSVTPDPKYYFERWFDIIGLAIACGKELGSQELRDCFPEDIYNEIVLFLEKHYTSNAWAQVGW